VTASQPSNSTVAPGTVLAGKYRVERVLGQGGMGLVVEARHLQLDERVALKFLQPDYASHPEAAARFLREARAAVKIKSAHVARVSDVGTLESGAPYMVMEYLEGSDVSNLIERSVLSTADAVDYVIQASEAIAEAHSYGIIHRDLKPANLFVTKHRDGAPLVKVLDFGISKVMGGQGVDSLTRTTAAMGSALYMSPEQMQQTRSVDHRTDIYALGVAIYEMLAGKQPFYADTLPQLCAEILTGTPTPLRQLRPDIPEQLAWTIEKAYARDRAHRYQSIAEMVVALAPWAPPRTQSTIDRISRMAGMNPPTAGAPPAVAPQPGPWSDQGPSPVAASGAATQVLAQASGGAPFPGARTSDPVIVPGPYSAPASSHAKANFARGAISDPTMTIPKRSNAGALVAMAIAATAVIGGIILFFALRSGPEPDGGPATGETGAPVATAEPPVTPPPTTAEAPPPPQTAAPAETAAPVETAAPTATAAAKPGTKPPVTQKPPATTPTAKPSAKPTAAPKGNNAEDYR
jgi:eukaryotic-like serine/threonine-protein kinase